MSEQLVGRLHLATIASCTCLTKSHEPAAHADTCRFRLLMETIARIEALVRERDDLDKLGQEATETLGRIRDEYRTRAESAEAQLAALTKPLAEPELGEIERRAEAATRGPWRLFSLNGVVAVMHGAKEVVKWTGFDGSDYPKRAEDNARFIAHARTDIPRILTALRAERAARERVEQEEAGWVIEHGASEVSRPRYWGGIHGWTYDNLQAVRFAREADARSEAEAMDDGFPGNYRICEHLWVGPAPLKARAALPERGDGEKANG